MPTRLFFHEVSYSGTYYGIGWRFPTAEQSSGTASTTWPTANTMRLMRTDTDAVGSHTTQTQATQGISTPQLHFIRMFASRPIAASGYYGGAGKTVYLNTACSESNASANFWADGLHVYAWRPSTNTKVGTFVDNYNTNLGTEPNANNQYKVILVSGVATSTVPIQRGDILVCEVWADFTQATTTSRTAGFAYDGSVQNEVANTTVTDHASFINFTDDFTFYDGIAVFDGAGEIRSNAITLKIKSGAAKLDSDSELAASGKVIRRASARLDSQSEIKSNGTEIEEGHIQLNLESESRANGKVTRKAVTKLDSNSELKTIGNIVKAGHIQLNSESELKTNGSIIRNGLVQFDTEGETSSNLTQVTAGQTRYGAAALDNEFELSVISNVIRGGSVRFDAKGEVYALLRQVIPDSDKPRRFNKLIVPDSRKIEVNWNSPQADSLVFWLRNAPACGGGRPKDLVSGHESRVEYRHNKTESFPSILGGNAFVSDFSGEQAPTTTEQKTFSFEFGRNFSYASRDNTIFSCWFYIDETYNQIRSRTPIGNNVHLTHGSYHLGIRSDDTLAFGYSVNNLFAYNFDIYKQWIFVIGMDFKQYGLRTFIYRTRQRTWTIPFHTGNIFDYSGNGILLDELHFGCRQTNEWVPKFYFDDVRLYSYKRRLSENSTTDNSLFRFAKDIAFNGNELIRPPFKRTTAFKGLLKSFDTAFGASTVQSEGEISTNLTRVISGSVRFDAEGELKLRPRPVFSTTAKLSRNIWKPRFIDDGYIDVNYKSSQAEGLSFWLRNSPARGGGYPRDNKSNIISRTPYNVRGPSIPSPLGGNAFIFDGALQNQGLRFEWADYSQIQTDGLSDGSSADSWIGLFTIWLYIDKEFLYPGERIAGGSQTVDYFEMYVDDVSTRYGRYAINYPINDNTAKTIYDFTLTKQWIFIAAFDTAPSFGATYLYRTREKDWTHFVHHGNLNPYNVRSRLFLGQSELSNNSTLKLYYDDVRIYKWPKRYFNKYTYQGTETYFSDIIKNVAFNGNELIRPPFKRTTAFKGLLKSFDTAFGASTVQSEGEISTNLTRVISGSVRFDAEGEVVSTAKLTQNVTKKLEAFSLLYSNATTSGATVAQVVYTPKRRTKLSDNLTDCQIFLWKYGRRLLYRPFEDDVGVLLTALSSTQKPPRLVRSERGPVYNANAQADAIAQNIYLNYGYGHGATWSIWVKPQVEAVNQYWLYGSYSQIYKDTSNVVYATIDGTNFMSVASADVDKLFHGHWTNVVLKVDNSKRRQYLYVNGKLVATATTSLGSIALISTSFTIAYLNVAKYLIDEVRLFNRPLQHHEIVQLHRETSEPLRDFTFITTGQTPPTGGETRYGASQLDTKVLSKYNGALAMIAKPQTFSSNLRVGPIRFFTRNLIERKPHLIIPKPKVPEPVVSLYVGNKEYINNKLKVNVLSGSRFAIGNNRNPFTGSRTVTHATNYSRYLIPGLGNIVAANRYRSRYDKSFCTIMYYMYTTQLSGDSPLIAYQADDSGNSYLFFNLGLAPSSYVFSDYSSGAKIWFNPTFQLRRWYHITHQLSSTHNRIIVNYLENPKAYVATKWIPRYPYTVSQTPIETEGILSINTGFFFRLSDIYIYDYALSIQEINAAIKNQFTRRDKSRQKYWFVERKDTKSKVTRLSKNLTSTKSDNKTFQLSDNLESRSDFLFKEGRIQYCKEKIVSGLKGDTNGFAVNRIPFDFHSQLPTKNSERGKSIYFNDSTTYNCKISKLDMRYDATISIWFKIIKIDFELYLFYHNLDTRIQLRDNTGIGPYFNFFSVRDSDVSYVPQYKYLPINQWNNVIITHKLKREYLYLNGKLIYIQTTPSPISGSSNLTLYFGNFDPDFINEFYIDEFRIFKGYISPAEAAQLYNETKFYKDVAKPTIITPSSRKREIYRGQTQRALSASAEKSSVPRLNIGAAPKTPSYDEAQKLLASDRANNENFGWSVACSQNGSKLFIGAPYEDASPNNDNGAVYVFTNDGGGSWSQTQKLLASDREDYDYFGVSVACSQDGSKLFIGSHWEDTTPYSANGAVYVFVNEGSGSWSQIQKLLASDREDDYDFFGVSVACLPDGSKLFIGAYAEDTSPNTQNGAVYVFTNDGSGSWSETQKLLASDREDYERFGRSVACSQDGSKLFIGADNENTSPSTNNGAVYVFTNDGSGSWSEAQKLLASDRANDDYFGWSVACSQDGSKLFIGKDYENTSPYSDNGAVYVFVNEGSGSWSQTQKLLASDYANNDYFGWSVACSQDGSKLFIGAAGKSALPNFLNGAVYVFTNDGSGSWSEAQKLLASYRADEDYFGWSVACSQNGSKLFIGAPYEDASPNSNNGAVYVFNYQDGSRFSPRITPQSSASHKPRQTISGRQYLDMIAEQSSVGRITISAYESLAAYVQLSNLSKLIIGAFAQLPESAEFYTSSTLIPAVYEMPVTFKVLNKSILLPAILAKLKLDHLKEFMGEGQLPGQFKYGSSSLLSWNDIFARISATMRGVESLSAEAILKQLAALRIQGVEKLDIQSDIKNVGKITMHPRYSFDTEGIMRQAASITMKAVKKFDTELAVKQLAKLTMKARKQFNTQIELREAAYITMRAIQKFDLNIESLNRAKINIRARQKLDSEADIKNVGKLSIRARKALEDTAELISRSKTTMKAISKLLSEVDIYDKARLTLRGRTILDEESLIHIVERKLASAAMRFTSEADIKNVARLVVGSRHIFDDNTELNTVVRLLRTVRSSFNSEADLKNIAKLIIRNRHVFTDNTEIKNVVSLLRRSQSSFNSESDLRNIARLVVSSRYIFDDNIELKTIVRLLRKSSSSFNSEADLRNIAKLVIRNRHIFTDNAEIKNVTSLLRSSRLSFNNESDLRNIARLVIRSRNILDDNIELNTVVRLLRKVRAAFNSEADLKNLARFIIKNRSSLLENIEIKNVGKLNIRPRASLESEIDLTSISRMAMAIRQKFDVFSDIHAIIAGKGKNNLRLYSFGDMSSKTVMNNRGRTYVLSNAEISNLAKINIQSRAQLQSELDTNYSGYRTIHAISKLLDNIELDNAGSIIMRGTEKLFSNAEISFINSISLKAIAKFDGDGEFKNFNSMYVGAITKIDTDGNLKSKNVLVIGSSLKSDLESNFKSVSKISMKALSKLLSNIEVQAIPLSIGKNSIKLYAISETVLKSIMNILGRTAIDEETDIRSRGSMYVRSSPDFDTYSDILLRSIRNIYNRTSLLDNIEIRGQNSLIINGKYINDLNSYIRNIASRTIHPNTNLFTNIDLKNRGALRISGAQSFEDSAEIVNRARLIMRGIRQFTNSADITAISRLLFSGSTNLDTIIDIYSNAYIFKELLSRVSLNTNLESLLRAKLLIQSHISTDDMVEINSIAKLYIRSSNKLDLESYLGIFPRIKIQSRHTFIENSDITLITLRQFFAQALLMSEGNLGIQSRFIIGSNKSFDINSNIDTAIRIIIGGQVVTDIDSIIKILGGMLYNAQVDILTEAELYARIINSRQNIADVIPISLYIGQNHITTVYVSQEQLLDLVISEAKTNSLYSKIIKFQ